MPWIRNNTTLEVTRVVQTEGYDMGAGANQWSIIADPPVDIPIGQGTFNGTWSRTREALSPGKNVGSGVHGLRSTIEASSVIDLALDATALPVLAMAANRLDFIPFIPGRALVCNTMAVDVTTLAAGSELRLGIYSSGTLGVPFNRLAQSSNLSGATVGLKSWAFPHLYEFEKGGIYWLAVQASAAVLALRHVAIAASLPIGQTAPTAATMATLRRATPAFSGGLPAVAPASTPTSAVVPHIRLTLAE